MNRIAVFALFTVPLLCFISAGVIELRQDRGSLRSLRRMLPIAVAAVSSILLLLFAVLELSGWNLYLSNWNLLAAAISGLSFLAAVGSFFGRYKSRVATALIFVGGLALAILWLLTRLRA